jgi:hypothetical protein
MVAVKKQIQDEGINAFEQDPRYKKVTQCRTNIDEIFDEEKCRNLNKKPSYNSYNTYNSSSFFGTHRYDPNYPVIIRIELSVMNALKDKFSYPYTGSRSPSDPKDIHSYPRYTVNGFIIERVKSSTYKYDITDRCSKKFKIIYEKDAEDAAKQAAKAAKDAENAAAKAAKDAEKAAKDAEKAAKNTEKKTEKAEKNTEKKTEKAAKQAAEKAMKEKLREKEKEEKAAAKAEKKAQNKTKKTPPKEPSPKIPSPNPNEKRKRCPNGTRKNKKTGSCEKYDK